MSADADWQNRRRRLTASEVRLWASIARGVRPLRSADKPVQRSEARPPKPSLRRNANPAETLATLSLPPASPSRTLQPTVPSTPVAIAKRERRQLSRGQAQIDARLDLHGMTQNEAHRALLRFVARCQAQGTKFALIVTGKGAPDTLFDARGVLRRQVPLWLASGEFRAYVVGFDIAGRLHGGDGALYLRIRRISKNP
jgi:DNA-nicking Smr family endonuclease